MSSFSVSGSKIRPRKLLPTGKVVRRERTSLTTSLAPEWRPRLKRRRMNANAAYIHPSTIYWRRFYSPEEEVTILSRIGFPKEPLCTNYLANSEYDEPRADWQHRMQNLSISCALVCLIVLGSAALVGFFGVCKHQISAVLVTGVLYLLAGLFAMFTLMIIHFKRIQRVSSRGSSHGDDTGDGVIGPPAPAMTLLSAREFSTSWSLELGWGGVALATTTSLLWILLSKIMRYNPISTMIM